MDKVWKSGAISTLTPYPGDVSKGYPTDIGAPPFTVPGAYWYFMITMEMLNVILAAGIDPDPTDVGQLAQAVASLGGNPPYDPGGDYAEGTALAELQRLGQIIDAYATGIQGTDNQVLISQIAAGMLGVALPQDIGMQSSPRFAGLAVDKLSGAGNVQRISWGTGAGSNSTPTGGQDGVVGPNVISVVTVTPSATPAPNGNIISVAWANGLTYSVPPVCEVFGLNHAAQGVQGTVGSGVLCVAGTNGYVLVGGPTPLTQGTTYQFGVHPLGGT